MESSNLRTKEIIFKMTGRGGKGLEREAERSFLGEYVGFEEK